MSEPADLATLINLVNQVTNGKEYFISTVLGRLDDAAGALPHDGAIRAAQRTLQQRLAANGSLGTITQRQFQDVYDDVSGLGNRTAFRDLLGDLLITAAPSPIANYNADLMGGMRNAGDMVNIVNSDMTDSFVPLWSEASTVSVGSFLDNGRKGLEIEFSGMGFDNVSAAVLNRNEHVVIYAVEATGPIGVFTAYVPAEIKLGSVLMPSVFVSGDRFVDLNKDNLLRHAQATIADGLKTVAAHKILDVLTAAMSVPESVETSDVDSQWVFAAPALYRNAEDGAVQTLSVEAPLETMPDVLVEFASGDIKDALIEMGLNCGQELVLGAKAIVAEQLRSAGVRVERITVDSEFDGGIMIAASIVGSGGKKTLQVPVEIIDNQVLMPSVFTSGTTVEAFERGKIAAFASDNSTGIFNAAFSNKMGWGFKDLHAHVMKSAVYGNFIEAEEAMLVIAEQYGADFHRSAFADLTDLMSRAHTEEVKKDDVETLIADAVLKAQISENRIKMSDTMMYLHPED